MKLPNGPWRFYVYALTHGDEMIYVGKGTGYRLHNQKREFSVQGHEVARFAREKDAYTFERKAISDHRPRLNVHAGGNGARVTPQRAPRLDKEDREMLRLGTRLYAIKLLRRFGSGFNLDWNALSKVEMELSAGLHG